MSEHFELPSIEQPKTAKPAEAKEAAQQTFISKEKLSPWQKLKAMKTGIATGMTLAFYVASGNVAEAKKSELMPQVNNRPAAEQVHQESFKTKMQKMEFLYFAGFSDKSSQSIYDIHKLIEDIHKSPEFQHLEPSAKAEILHREGYSLLSANKAWFEENYKKLPKASEHLFLKDYPRIIKSFEYSISMEGEGSARRERSVNALIETSKTMVEQYIRLNVERPDLPQVSKQLKEDFEKPLETAFYLDPRMRYVGDNMLLFPEKNRANALSQVLGLLKFNDNLPANATIDQAVETIGGAIFDVKKNIVPWANAVKTGKFPASSSEQAFIDNMVRLKILQSKDNQYMPGDVENLIFTSSNPLTFSHEIAHRVARKNSEYLNKAALDYQRLTPQDRAKFDTFMEVDYQNFTKEKRLEEYFAYNNEAGDWRLQADQAENKRNREIAREEYKKTLPKKYAFDFFSKLNSNKSLSREDVEGLMKKAVEGIREAPPNSLSQIQDYYQRVIFPNLDPYLTENKLSLEQFNKNPNIRTLTELVKDLDKRQKQKRAQELTKKAKEFAYDLFDNLLSVPNMDEETIKLFLTRRAAEVYGGYEASDKEAIDTYNNFMLPHLNNYLSEKKIDITKFRQNTNKIKLDTVLIKMEQRK